MKNKSNLFIGLVLIILIIVQSSYLYAANSSIDNEVSLFLIVTGLLGGLGMFLYGMEMMSDGMKIAAGNKMRSVLEKLTSNRLLAVGVGGRYLTREFCKQYGQGGGRVENEQQR